MSDGQQYFNYPDFFSEGDPPCTQVDPDMFFPDPERPNMNYTTKLAKEVCESCVYKLECLKWAMDTNEIGIWGGTTDGDRRRLKRGQILSPPKRWSGK